MAGGAGICYRGALLYGSAKRRELLDKAAAGFGEFATAQSDNPIIAESRLGRGLAYLELEESSGKAYFWITV